MRLFGSIKADNAKPHISWRLTFPRDTSDKTVTEMRRALAERAPSTWLFQLALTLTARVRRHMSVWLGHALFQLPLRTWPRMLRPASCSSS